MDVSGAGKSPNSSFSFRYNATNEELEELYNVSDDDPPTPQNDISLESSSPKKAEKSPSILDKYFKSMKADKTQDKLDEPKVEATKQNEEVKQSQKEVTSSPMKEYLNRLSKKTVVTDADGKEVPNETWKIFHDFKYKIAQAVEDIKFRSNEEQKEKSVPRDNSISDSEDNSGMKDSDQQSVGDTDNQVSSLDSSIQNLSELSQPITTKTNKEQSLNTERVHRNSESTDDTHKNFDPNESIDFSKDIQDDSSLLDIESGIEALEDINIDAEANPSVTDGAEKTPQKTSLPSSPRRHFHPQPLPQTMPKLMPKLKRKYILNFSMYFFTFILLASCLINPEYNLTNGFLLGLWVFCLGSNIRQLVVDVYLSDGDDKSLLIYKDTNVINTYTIPSVKEHKPIKKYEGWVNHYRSPDYDPFTYHIAKTTTAFMKLEGCNLRISYTKTKVAKRALWDEIIDKVTFYQHRLYNLNGARVILLPKGLVRKRQWSKKYPICIVLNEEESIQVLEKEGLSAEKRASESSSAIDKKVKEGKEQYTPDVESTETNTSPEKKKKFVWRRRERSTSESEPGKEGLRHRLVRKMHRDKKTDSSTCTEPEVQADKDQQMDDASIQDVDLDITKNKDDDPEDLNDSELSKIKDFLEEAECEEPAESPAEGEWTIHVKSSRDGHSHLYLFARTGREKHEWYRRLVACIAESTEGSNESSNAEDKPPSEENKEDIELTVYRSSDKDAVTFNKGSTKNESPSEGVVSSILLGPQIEDGNPEKAFWPYLFKILQRHAEDPKHTVEVGILCHIDPSPEDKSKGKKNRKAAKAPTNDCDCSLLPMEVTWLNAMIARMMFDIMREARAAALLKTRLQRKLNTLKLPSIMSPLLVTEVSLSGACPLLERVSPPSWDERGVWIDADVKYDGGAYVTVLTQINLLKVKEKSGGVQTEESNLTPDDEAAVESESLGGFTEQLLMKRKPAIFDSDIEDSAESSSDEEGPATSDDATDVPDAQPQSAGESGSSKKKFLRMVDKITTNKYFQQVTDYKYVKRAMEGLSNTDIKLRLELKQLEGRLAINLPPPPHDRIWFGFRTNPQLILKARPAFGASNLRFTRITNWIEQKLCKEFEKVLVLPNMEDIVVDLMVPTPLKFE